LARGVRGSNKNSFLKDKYSTVWKNNFSSKRKTEPIENLFIRKE